VSTTIDIYSVVRSEIDADLEVEIREVLKRILDAESLE
jgi:hypothetical protein